MKLLSPFISCFCFAIPRTRWFIDGNNLMGHKGTPRDRQSIADKLRPIQNMTSDLSVTLVWDGKKGFESIAIEKNEENDDISATTTTIPRRNSFQVVSLAEGMNADDYILQELLRLKASPEGKSSSVQVVTADRALRRRVLEIKPIIRGVVNPVVFWRRYRPRLTGMKSNYANEPKLPEDNE